MYGFNGFDINGNSCFVGEQGGDLGVVKLGICEIPAVRLNPSVYMSIYGKVYAAVQQDCIKYATTEWFNWARRKMISVGFDPNF